VAFLFEQHSRGTTRDRLRSNQCSSHATGHAAEAQCLGGPEARRVTEHFEVVVDTYRLQGTSHRNVTGPVAVRLGDAWFPEREWNDFPVIVLGWWVRQLPDLAQGIDGEFAFMDGPFRFSVIFEAGGARIVFEDLHADQLRVVSEAAISADVVAGAIAAAAKGVVKACEGRGWTSCDIDELRMGAISGQREQRVMR